MESIVMDTPLAISLLQFVISLVVKLSYVIRNKHSFCPARVGTDWRNWRRQPKWKHTFYITAFAQTALLTAKNFTSGSRTRGLGCNEVDLTAGLVRSTLTSLEVWQVCKNPADSTKSDTSPAQLLGSHHWGDQQKDNPQNCISRQLWGTKHEATEAQQLLCSLHKLLGVRSMRQEALSYFTETLLRLNWFSNSLPTPYRTSLSLVWQIKKILNKTQCEQIFSYLCYPSGDRLKISKSCNNSLVVITTGL